MRAFPVFPLSKLCYVEILPKRPQIEPHGAMDSCPRYFSALAISGVDRMASEAMMGHSLSSFGIESIYNYAVSRLDYLRGEYLKALNNLLFLKEPRGMKVVNGVARKRIEELEEKVMALEEAIRFYENLMKYLKKRIPNCSESSASICLLSSASSYGLSFPSSMSFLTSLHDLGGSMTL
jgi:hypothetical protein